MSVRTRPIAVLFAAVWCSAALAQDTAGLLRQLQREKDDADVAIVERIARAGGREAAVGRVSDEGATLLFRRAIVQALGSFATDPSAQEPALEKLAQIAGSADEENLRQLAIDGLARSPTVGKQFLRRLVDSKAPDVVREPAMRAHVALAAVGDADWYRELWNLEQKQRKDADGEIRPLELNTIRQLAFAGLASTLTEGELVEALKREYDPKIRRRALDQMDKSSMPKVAEMAEWLLDRVDFPGVDRAEAARILMQRSDDKDKVVQAFLKLAKKRDVTQADLRAEMARLIAELRDDKIAKKVQKLVGKGKPHEQVFALQATAKDDDPKLLATIRKSLKDKDPEVRRAAAEVLGARRDRESLPTLRSMLEKPADPADARAALEAIDRIEGPMTAWLNELAGYTRHGDRDVRNAAVEVLGKARDKRQLEPLLAALEHDDWSTRDAAIDALACLRLKDVVGRFVERIGKESGRMRRHLADALWQLTAQPFEEDPEKWRQWWATAATDFTVATEKEVGEAEKARERRRLTQRTVSKAQFFGIRIESHRVIFVIDVSGSMLESMYGRTVEGRRAARIDVAKAELAQAIQNLEPGALFNVFAFSNGVARWQEGGIGTDTAQDRKAALTWVERLGASGGTNLYDSMCAAFADPDVDTIFVLSDGEPTAGDVLDPHSIREEVARWNRHRKVAIHTIAIGGNLEVLEWLARDAGGTYRQMR